MSPGGYEVIPEPAAAAIESTILTSGISDYLPLIHRLRETEVRHEAPWVLDLRPPGPPIASVPVRDGPLPLEASVYSNSVYRGDILIWVAGGRLSGLEYAWITEAPPSRWPQPHEIRITR